MTSVSSSSSGALAASQTNAKQTIAGNFDTFLQLLTTQLQNQNPLDPLDTNQFTSQLVQFSSVEQQLRTNDLLTTLVSANAAGIVSASAGYLGAEITADGSVTTLAAGKAAWTLNAAKPAAKATFSVIDASTGATVYTATRSLDAGAGSFVWDGRGGDGSLYSAGSYKLKIDAVDAAGQPVAVSTEISGKVDAVDLSGDTPLLKIGDISVALDKVKTLRKSAS
ncbi:flagellar hook assembly protein FlgD [Labrys wisconsinensis]|uniref:Basal-body rod modification protein FlgD n=1 Tax=Labrys wisconsinensis TaxID=425677 RepID=A0ABU0JAM0_9HYPH|nr:flagellar hook capping FlgD N-terminal domain-containing protein [Labrys wisconsinensis]MDQ0471304.1 flagellar basal-body rod modification protein FlgD [Labrys wisconsinensis]